MQGQESINFQDVLCQMVDMISPKDANTINLVDMLKPEKRLISGSYLSIYGYLLSGFDMLSKWTV